MKYHFRIRKEKGGYWADCVKLVGCRTEGDTLAELNENMREAVDLFLDEPPASALVHPLPRKRLGGPGIVEVPVSSPIAFATYLRALRHEHSMT